MKITQTHSKESAAISPEDGLEEEFETHESSYRSLKETNSNLQRQNITDPGEENIKTETTEKQTSQAFGEQAELTIFSQPVNIEANNRMNLYQGSLSVHEAIEGKSLRKTLANWAKADGIKLIWDVTYDYDIEASLVLNDTFSGAVKTVIEEGFKTPQSRPALQLLLGQSKEDNITVLVVSENFQDAVKAMFSEGGLDIEKDKSALKMLSSSGQAEQQMLFVENRS